MIKRVFVIGLDGAGNAIKDVETPNIDLVIKEGAYTFDGDTSRPPISGECWGSLFHGVPAHKHQLTNDIVKKNPYPEDSMYPSFMKLVRQEWEDCSLAAFSCWSPINRGIIEESTNCYCISKPDKELNHEITDYISKNDPRVLFVQFDDIDDKGHTYGYRSKEYYDEIKLKDDYFGQIIDAIKNAGMFDESLIIVTADHGGGGTDSKSHSSDHPDNTEIFWGCYGPNINKGFRIEEEVNIMDTAAVVAYALGINIPDTWDAKVPRGIFK